MAKTYYKVVYDNGNGLHSAVVRYYDVGVQYTIDRWTKAKLYDSPLFVFEKLEYAQLFILGASSRKYKIYECHIKGIRKHAKLVELYELQKYFI